MGKYLRFYAEGKPGRWEAICLDLDIAVQGASPQDVMAAMEKAVILYVEEAMKLPEPDRVRLLRRRAPLSMRLKFFWYLWLALFRRMPRNSGKSRMDYLAPFPA